MGFLQIKVWLPRGKWVGEKGAARGPLSAKVSAHRQQFLPGGLAVEHGGDERGHLNGEALEGRQQCYR